MSEEVVFYSWIEDQPSSLTVRISGGQRVKDSNSGAIMSTGYKEVRFNMGMLRTSDAETIKEIRRLIVKGESITEDKEDYLSHVMKPEDQAKRAARRIKAADNTIAEQDKEINRLRAELKKAQGAAK